MIAFCHSTCQRPAIQFLCSGGSPSPKAYRAFFGPAYYILVDDHSRLYFGPLRPDQLPQSILDRCIGVLTNYRFARSAICSASSWARPQRPMAMLCAAPVPNSLGPIGRVFRFHAEAMTFSNKMANLPAQHVPQHRECPRSLVMGVPLVSSCRCACSAPVPSTVPTWAAVGLRTLSRCIIEPDGLKYARKRSAA
jgi:hypothetical protein